MTDYDASWRDSALCAQTACQTADAAIARAARGAPCHPTISPPLLPLSCTRERGSQRSGRGGRAGRVASASARSRWRGAGDE